MSSEALIAWSVLAPAVAALGVALTGRWPNLRESITLVFGVITAGLVFQLGPLVNAGERPTLVLLELFPGLPLVFEVEPLGMLFAMVASGLWGITSLYAIGYMRGHHEQNQTRFFVCFALAISAALGIAYAGNLITLFLFYELLTFSTYPLVTHHGTENAMKAGRVYLGILVGTSVCFLLLAILWTWTLTGRIDFEPGGILAGKIEGPEVGILLGLYAFGIGKAALMPFHRWLPAAMVAPTPVSALLHAVAVVKAGVFSVLKIVVYVFGIEFLSSTEQSLWLMYVAAATILIASIVALQQDNLKRRLAYSTISQLAYIVLGAALATHHAVLGGGMHIVMHAFGKITLFFCAGAIYVASGKTKISDMDGIGRVMPVTLAAFLIGSLCVIGLPPFGGAWSKYFLALGSLEAGHVVFVAVLMISSLLNVAYLLPIVARGFFAGSAQEQGAGIKEAPALCLVPLCVTAFGCLVLFFCADVLFDLLEPIVGGGSR